MTPITDGSLVPSRPCLGEYTEDVLPKQCKNRKNRKNVLYTFNVSSERGFVFYAFIFLL